MTLPTVQVLLDDGTGTFPYDITSKVMLLDGFSFTRGREDWQDGVTAGTFSLTLNNSDGRFSPGSTTIASPSPIRVDQRIRLKETVNGVTYTRFTGYVKSWPVAWPATVSTFSTVQVTASDAQARAERRVLRSVVEEEILADTPVAYFTLSEPAGATSVADSSGQYWASSLAMVGSGTDVVFGTAIGSPFDGLTAAQFGGGKYLAGSVVNNNLNGVALEAEFVTSSNGVIARLVTPPDGSGNTITLELSVVAGKAQLQRTSTSGTGDYTLTSTTTVTDGLRHHVGAGVSNLFLVVDGVTEASTASFGTAPFQPAAAMYIGGAPGGTSFNGSIAHVSVVNQLTTWARVQSHASATITGFAGESGTARITRLAGYASAPVGTLDTSLTNVPFTDFTGRSAWDCIQEVADAEVGVAYIDGTGSLVFHNRNRVAAKTTPDLTLAATYVVPDAQPTQDDQRILNYLESTATGTGITQVVNNATSGTNHGRYSDSKSYLVSTDAEALDRANWIVGNFAEPSTRFGTLTINLYKMDAATASSVIAAIDIDCWLQITGMPSQTPGGTTVDLVVESVAEQVTGSSWTLTCNVVAQSLFDVWILGDATAGVLGTTTRLYV